MNLTAEKLASLIRAAAIDLNESADAIADKALVLPITSMHITIDIGCHGGLFDSVPIIEVNTEHLSKRAIDVFTKRD